MNGALAFISMPGLGAVVVGLGLCVLGALVLLVGLVRLALAVGHRSDRPAAAGTAVAGLVLALAGLGVVVLGDTTGYGDFMDVAALVLAPVAIGAAVLAGWLLDRALRRAPASAEREAGGPPP